MGGSSASPQGKARLETCKMPSSVHQRPDSASWDRKSLDLIKMGQALEQRARQRIID